MTYSYPYKSHLRTALSHRRLHLDYELWQGVPPQNLVTALPGPVVEIGGPTQDGFYFLDGIEFNTHISITNISPRPLPLSPDAEQLAKLVDTLIDATNMPFKDESVDIFLMAAMSISSDWWVELRDDARDSATPRFEQEFANARFEMGQVAAGIREPHDVTDAQRVKIYLEIARCLSVDGLLFADGDAEDLAILKRLGFEVVALLQTQDEGRLAYEFIMKNMPHRHSS